MASPPRSRRQAPRAGGAARGGAVDWDRAPVLPARRGKAILRQRPSGPRGLDPPIDRRRGPVMQRLVQPLVAVAGDPVGRTSPQTRGHARSGMPTRRHPIAENGPPASGPEPDRHRHDEDEDQRDRAEGGIADGPHDAGAVLDPAQNSAASLRCGNGFPSGTGAPRNAQSGPQLWPIS